ncbi:hypothetical protein CGCS363_v011189 [Colletotrichum siamense]|uniref:uncharacterized protein n=1 Tax=Colletotrichum siamense TaxID=690259 RepID=UPI0018725091|nr:uncharacterized protein CGCS363_v011189 [Colletotrichum siamense]KAF5491521.1 hypothetical protein CGCS363_v011189 [Colletotrichum siamense]
MSVAMVVLIAFLAVAISETGDIKQAWKFYESDCRHDNTKNMNTLLHLLINALSTVVLASSNFFMQVLNAPSRREVDAVHARGKWLDIGIPSWRNAFYLSRFKLAAWISLCLTSIPIHMLFNSSVFQMTSRFGDFGLYVASESFLKGEPYIFPGASLYINNGLQFEDLKTERSSAVRSNISTTAAKVSKWERLSAIQCQNIYRPNLCTGLKDYHNVVLIVDGPGWTRDDLWNLSTVADRLWEPIVPRYELNSLLMEDQCNMSGNTRSGVPGCNVDCYQLWKRDGGSRSASWSWLGLQPEIPWLIHVESPHMSLNRTLYSATEGEDYEFGARFTSFEVSYCMAEPSMSTCSVALSKPLMLAVVLSVLLKLVTCVVVVWVIGPQEPLVTPGDAVMSFISIEDRGSFSGVVTQDMVRRRKRQSNTNSDVYTFESIEPRHWAKRQQLRAMAIPRGVWVRTCGILLIGIIAAAVCLWQQLSNGTSL